MMARFPGFRAQRMESVLLGGLRRCADWILTEKTET